MVTTIQIDKKVKAILDKLKIHHRETYNELIERLIENCSIKETDKESLSETIEVLSNPKTMRNIAQALEDFDKGKLKTLDQIKKELNTK